ncbi:MAG: acylphosphatase [Chloroflexi bacterium]|nr:acylphosphatase [Chloroflexota bacterium]
MAVPRGGTQEVLLPDISGLYLTVHGRVQGVYFRAFVESEAEALGLAGYARNLPDGRSVEVYAEGDREALQKLLVKCRQGPPGARVERVEEEWKETSLGMGSFEIRY